LAIPPGLKRLVFNIYGGGLMSAATQALSFTDSTVKGVRISKEGVWAGRIVSAIVVLFLVFDGVMKIVKEPHVLEATSLLGYPERLLLVLGLVVLGCTLVYVTPGTSVLGAILLTGYLGGAVASNLRVGHSAFRDVVSSDYRCTGMGRIVHAR
jgi:hypothetical protein